MKTGSKINFVDNPERDGEIVLTLDGTKFFESITIYFDEKSDKLGGVRKLVELTDVIGSQKIKWTTEKPDLTVDEKTRKLLEKFYLDVLKKPAGAFEIIVQKKSRYIMPIKLTQKQAEIYRDDSRFKVVIAGRRGGKSWLSLAEICRHAGQKPRSTICYIAPTYPQAIEVIWNDLIIALTDANWVPRAVKSPLPKITIRNGSEILLRSAQNPDSLRGLGFDFVVFDEFADINPDTWSAVVQPALATKQGGALFIGTPKGEGTWPHELFLYASEPDHDRWSAHSYTTIEGGLVERSEIDLAKTILDRRTFEQEYEATFQSYAGKIYYNFNRDEHIIRDDIKPYPGERLHVGIDFNNNPMSSVVALLRDGDQKLYVIDSIEIYSSNTAEMIDEIAQRYPDNPIIGYPDATGGLSNTTSGISNHFVLRQAGWNVISRKANPRVVDRISAVNAAFESLDKTNRLLIHARANSLINSLTKQVYKPDTKQPDKDHGYDHLNDALGYMVHHLFPVKPPLPERQPNWGQF